MAIRKAVATGVWSNTAIWDGGTLPDVADTVHPNGFTVTIDQNVTVALISNAAGTGIVSGGVFIISGNRNVTTNYNLATGHTLFTFQSVTGTATFTGTSPNNVMGVAFNIASSCTGTINLVGNVKAGANYSSGLLSYQNGGYLNIVGNVTGGYTGGYGGSSIGAIITSTNTIITITGSVKGGASDQSSSGGISIAGTGNNVNITGDADCGLVSTTGATYSVSLGTGNSLTILGNAISRSGSSSGAVAVTAAGTYYLKIIGSITASRFANGVSATSTTGVNILTGPFISDQYGMSPLLCARMHIDPNPSSYFEFRDDTTNGSLLVAAPTYTLYPIGTAGDCPAEADVRDGVDYAFSSMTGTLAVPPTNTVATGVPVDNTVGTAILTAEDIANAVGEVVGAKIQASFP